MSIYVINEQYSKEASDDVDKIPLNLSAQNIKDALIDFKKDRNWLASSLNRSLSTINGWLSAGKSIPSECIKEIQGLFELEQKRQNKNTKFITAESDKEWEEWEKQAVFKTVQEWARGVLNKEVENTLLKSKKENKIYGNPIIFPLNINSEELWELVYDFSEITITDNGEYQFYSYNTIGEILNIATKQQLEKAIRGDISFSLKTAKKSSLDYATDDDFKKNRKMFIFSKKEVIMWSIAAELAGERNLNAWANKIIDENVQIILLGRMGVHDDEIPF